MKKRSKTYYEILFIVGLCLAIFVMLDLRYALLPDIISGILSGISISVLLGSGTFKHRADDNKNSVTGG